MDWESLHFENGTTGILSKLGVSLDPRGARHRHILSWRTLRRIVADLLGADLVWRHEQKASGSLQRRRSLAPSPFDITCDSSKDFMIFKLD